MQITSKFPLVLPLLLLPLLGKSQLSQVEYYEKGMEMLANHRFPSSPLGFFRQAYRENPNSDLGKQAFIKYDSIKTALRDTLIAEISGEWILYKAGSNWGYSYTKDENFIHTKLSITRDSIIEYQRDPEGAWFVYKSELLRFYDELLGVYPETYFIDRKNGVWQLLITQDRCLAKIQTSIYYEGSESRVVIACGATELYFEKVAH